MKAILAFLIISAFCESFLIRNSQQIQNFKQFSSDYSLHKYKNNNVKYDFIGKSIDQLEVIEKYSNQPNPIVFPVILAISLLFTPDISSAIPIDTSISYSYWDYHLRYFLSGGLCCAISHGISVPLDVIKTLKQSDNRLSSMTMTDIITMLLKENGFSVFLKGIGPTITGYFIQGSLKYGFYEIFKPFTKDLVHSDDIVSIIVSYMIAGLLAELIGSTVLSPFEATRIQLVTSSDKSSFVVNMLSMMKQGGFYSLFDSLPAILAKQLPYTMVQLSSYELISRNIYNYLSDLDYNTDNFKFLVSLVSASIAAFLSSLVSQPGDTLLTKINKSKFTSANVKGMNNTLKLMKSSLNDIGLKGLFVGTKARLYHVGIIVIVQLTVYDIIKQLCGLPVTGVH